VKLDHRGIIAIILATAIGLVLVLAVAGAVFSGRAMSEFGRDVLLALGGAIVGALAGYLSSKAVNGHQLPK